MGLLDAIGLTAISAAQPLNVTSMVNGTAQQIHIVTMTDPTQFAITTILTALGSVFILWFFFGSIFSGIKESVIQKVWIKKIIQYTGGRNLMIIKHTRSGGLFGPTSMIDQSTMDSMMKAMNKFGGKPFDLVLYTPGGDAFSGLYISKLLKQYPGQIRTIVPIYSMSAGTILALSGGELYMAPTSCLGPCDIQLGNLFKFGSGRSWEEIVKMKKTKAEDSSIAFAHMAKQYTKTMREHLKMLVAGKIHPSKEKEFLDFMTRGEVEHAYMLNPEKLKEFGLDVKILDSKFHKVLTSLLTKDALEGVHYYAKDE